MPRSTLRVRWVLAIASLMAATACAGRTRQPDLEPGERRAFRASSMHTELFIVGDFEGVVEVSRDSLLVMVTTGRIDARGRREDDVLLRVALARGDTAGRWHVGDASAATPLSGIRRNAGGTLLDTLRFSLKRSSRPLPEQWLAFVFEAPRAERAPDGRPLLHTSFAHSQRDVFRQAAQVGEAQP
ncbi:MAG TPA: hypothetical protein VJ650_08955 [Gemmatimonadaceae bacterium]|nr:hypothetical protein [Gemmatimonadaceae bacterium]